MIKPCAHYRQATSLSALLALLAVTGCAVLNGCALPPQLGFANRSDAALAALTLSPPPELVRENKPYPTVVQPGTVTNKALTPPVVTAPLPLQQPNTPTSIPLDPGQLASLRETGHSKNEAIAQPKESFSPSTPVGPARNVISPWREKDPITLDVSPSGSYVGELFHSLEKTLPATYPVGSFNDVVQAPVNVKPQPPQFDPPPIANQPPAPAPEPASETESVTELCQKLIVSLEQEIRQKSDRKEEDELPALQQKLRLLQLVAGHTDDAVDQVEQLPPAEREAYKQLMFALTTWLSPDDAKRASSRNAKILRALHEANNRLSAVSKLDLKNLMFCEKVESFGWYTEFQRAEFAPKQQVILYVEVQNFAAEEKTTTAFETELQGSYQIYDADGNIVDERKLPLDREICRNYRRDYFLAYRIYLPSELGAGRYRLELTIEDLKAKKDFKGRKQGEAMIEFAIK